MVVTSKVLGLALLSALSLAAPFEEYSLAARNADAVAEALLRFHGLETRNAEPEASFDLEEDAYFQVSCTAKSSSCLADMSIGP